MATHQQLNFLQEKIKEIGSAIFFNQSDAVLKLPTSLVSTLQVDDYGFVWFFVQRPKQSLQEFDKEFPARLDFFRKGSTCFLQVSGKGWLVTDPEEMNHLEGMTEEARHMAIHEMVLVKVKILKAEYYEPRAAVRHSWWQQAVNSVVTLFGSKSYRPDTYFPAS